MQLSHDIRGHPVHTILQKQMERGGLVVRGFVDIQVNGFDGVSFTEPGLTVADVQRAASKLVAAGTWLFCPTVVTCSEECLLENVATIVTAIESPPYSTHFLGLHLEGPFKNWPHSHTPLCRSLLHTPTIPPPPIQRPGGGSHGIHPRPTKAGGEARRRPGSLA